MSRSATGTCRSSATGSRSTTEAPTGVSSGGVSLPRLSNLPAPWRKIVDWLVTVAVAIGFVLAFEAEVAKPSRIPSASMEHPLHCALPRARLPRLDERPRARQPARIRLRQPSARTDRRLRGSGAQANNGCATDDAGTTFVKRLIGLPGETVREDSHGFIWIRGPGATRWTKLAEPYLSPNVRLADSRPTSGSPGRCRTAGTSWSATTDQARATRAPGEPFPRSNLIGPVIFTYWPPGRLSYHQGGS